MIYLLVEDSYFYNQNNDYELLRKKIAFSNKDLAIYLDNLQAEKKLIYFVALICQHFIGQKIYNLTNHFKT